MQSNTMLHTSLVRPTCFQSVRSHPSSRSGARATQQICCAHNRRDTNNLSLIAASCAAALVLQSSSADAKVIFEKVEAKKVFQGAAEKVKAATDNVTDSVPSVSAPSISLPKFNVPNLVPKIFSDGGDIDPRAVALPASLAAIGAGAFILSKVDPGFSDFMGAASVKDSSTGAGAGYEQDVQQFKNGDLKKGAKDNIKKVGSTINKKANQGGTKKKAGSSKSGGLRGVFGGK
ncbi:TPA: hypothetical protein ACH3X3_001522 [Trebouxia sp. C0006]